MEACDLNSIMLIRGLIQLKYAGWFDNVSMFIIGRSFNYQNKAFGINMKNAYKEVLEPLGKPIILDAPIGHFNPSLPIKLGVKAEVSFNRNRIKIKYEE